MADIPNSDPPIVLLLVLVVVLVVVLERIEDENDGRGRADP
jgi:hypothetical protein